MITRLYADNFRCLVNFELKLDRLNLLMGPNGSGKSTVFEVLRRLQSFVCGDCRIQQAFPTRDLTRWQQHHEQRFEVNVALGEGDFIYTLVIEHDQQGTRCRIKEEKLTEGKTTLYRRELGNVYLYRDDGSEGPGYPFDWTMSALATIQSRPENSKLTAFRNQMSNLVIASISPINMQSISEYEAEQLSPRMENFVSWYRRVSQENMSSMLELFGELKEIIPGFSSFSFKDAGQEAKTLRVLFERENERSKSYSYDFGELSDGQRVLIALYALLHASSEKNLCLFLDEPSNYVSLREIQPWLEELRDVCGERFDQAVLISHNPEIIDIFGPSRGILFSRGAEAPARVRPEVPTDEDGGLKLSELVARGWDQ